MKPLIFISLFFTSLTFSQPNAWKYLNFESGGYVTEIIPVKYPAGQQPPDISQQVLYARTDIGGIYRSTDNGQSWVYASTYIDNTGLNPGITKSETHIQGVAVRHQGPNWYSPQTVLVAWGNDESDAALNHIDYQCIWRSDNSGAEGSWIRASIQSPGVWFRGNELPVKIGGPCITYDPNNINDIYSHMYMGGFGPSDINGNPTRTYLYKSTNDGQTWVKVTSFEQQVSGLNGEGIICINIKEGNTQHLWVGTTHGIVFTTNAGVSWQRRNIPGVNIPYVKRILLQKDGSNNITGAMVTWGNWNTTGIGRLRANNSWNYEPLDSQFYSGYTGESYGMFSALAFVDDNETMIIAGRYERPLRKTTNFGNNWFGEINNSQNGEVVFRYIVGLDNNFPAHQQRGELDSLWGYMYDGLSCLTKNPNTNWGYQWYLSGGAGPRMTHPAQGI